MTMWTAEVYPSSGFAVFSGEGSGMFPAELDEGSFDNEFHEIWMRLSAGEAAPEWSFERPAEHRNARTDGRFLRFRDPDGAVITFRFCREVPDDRLDLWLAERLSAIAQPLDLPQPEPEPAADEPGSKENDNAQELGDRGHDLPASGGRPEGPEWVWQPQDRPQDPPSLPDGQPRRGRGRPRKHPRVDA